LQIVTHDPLWLAAMFNLPACVAGDPYHPSTSPVCNTLVLMRRPLPIDVFSRAEIQESQERNVDDVMDESSCHLALGKRIEVAVDKP
jgi:hypothetical protein